MRMSESAVASGDWGGCWFAEGTEGLGGVLGAGGVSGNEVTGAGWEHLSCHVVMTHVLNNCSLCRRGILLRQKYPFRE